MCALETQVFQMIFSLFSDLTPFKRQRRAQLSHQINFKFKCPFCIFCTTFIVIFGPGIEICNLN